MLATTSSFEKRDTRSFDLRAAACETCGAKGKTELAPWIPWFCSECLDHARSHTVWDDIGVGD